MHSGNIFLGQLLGVAGCKLVLHWLNLLSCAQLSSGGTTWKAEQGTAAMSELGVLPWFPQPSILYIDGIYCQQLSQDKPQHVDDLSVVSWHNANVHHTQVINMPQQPVAQSERENDNTTSVT